MSIRNVTKRELCPICGKPDWCTILSDSSSDIFHELNICRRSHVNGDVVSLINGQRYTFIKELSDGSHLFEETKMRETVIQAWCQKEGKHFSRIQRDRPAYESMNQLNGNELPRGCAEPLGHSKLHLIYSSFLSKLALYGKHRAYLLNDGWGNELIKRSLVRSIPSGKNSIYVEQRKKQITKELIQEFGSVCGVPGFYRQSDGNWTFVARSGLFIPIWNHRGEIYRLRIRLDCPEKDKNGKEKNKYNNFASFYVKMDESGKAYNVFNEGCKAGNHISIYSQEEDDFTVCYVTEGEKKALRANDELQCPVISIPGVNSFKKLIEVLEDGTHVLDYLKSKGCRIIIIAFDADKTVNEAVLKYEEKLVTLLKGYGFQIALANWNIGFGKGLDDIFNVNVRPNYSLVCY